MHTGYLESTSIVAVNRSAKGINLTPFSGARAWIEFQESLSFPLLTIPPLGSMVLLSLKYDPGYLNDTVSGC